MIIITQLVYIKEHKEAVFEEFERAAIPIIAKYKGKLLLRIRPGKEAFIEGTAAIPYEIHLVQFNEESDFERFLEDEERKQYFHLKEESVRTVILIKGSPATPLE